MWLFFVIICGLFFIVRCFLGFLGFLFIGIVNDILCYYEDNDNFGCGVIEINNVFYGVVFVVVGGGVFVIELVEFGIFIWFFSWFDIFDVISNVDDEIDISILGIFSVYWGIDICDIIKFFGD